ncbi:MAG: transcriptional activator RfaH [Hyphomicrobium sp.]
MQFWFVIYTHPREEAVAEENLRRQGFVTYWPRYRRRSSHARKIRDVPAALFPRYLFATFDRRETGWRSIRSTRGVADLVRNGHDPVPVPLRFIEEIRAREDADGYVVLAHQVELYKGQRIRLQSEAFRSHDLFFEAKKDSDRVVALLRLLGREFEVELPVGSIVPAA